MKIFEEKIETLTKLLASLDIPWEVHNEDVYVVFDYSLHENLYIKYISAHKKK